MNEEEQEFGFPYPIVMIKWIDHFSTQGWVNPKDIGGEAEAVSIGMLVKETDTCYFISTTYMENEDVCDPLAVMKQCVKQFVKMELPSNQEAKGIRDKDWKDTPFFEGLS